RGGGMGAAKLLASTASSSQKRGPQSKIAEQENKGSRVRGKTEHPLTSPRTGQTPSPSRGGLGWGDESRDSSRLHRVIPAKAGTPVENPGARKQRFPLAGE